MGQIKVDHNVGKLMDFASLLLPNMVTNVVIYGDLQ